MLPQLFCEADFMVSLENSSVATARFGKRAVQQQRLPSGELGLQSLVCRGGGLAGGEEMGVKGGRAGVRCGPRTGSQTCTLRLGLSFPTGEWGGGLTCLPQWTLQGCKMLSPSHPPRRGGAPLGGEGRAGAANAG